MKTQSPASNGDGKGNQFSITYTPNYKNHLSQLSLSDTMANSEMSLPEGKLGLFWLLSAFAMTAGAWVLGLENATSNNVFFTFILVLFAGLSWIGVAVGVVHSNKKR